MGEDRNLISKFLRGFVRNLERIAQRHERLRDGEGEEWKNRDERDEGDTGHERSER